MIELKLKMSEVIAANDAIIGLQKEKPPISISVALCDLSDSLESKITIYQKELKKLLDEFAKKDDKGELVPVLVDDKPNGQIQLEKPKEYFEGLKVLDDTEVPIMFNPIDLGDIRPEVWIVKVLRKFFKTE